MTEQMTLEQVIPQPSYIESSGRWEWLLPEHAQFPGCCKSVVTASREWWEYTPSEARPHPMAEAIQLRDGIWYWVIPSAIDAHLNAAKDEAVAMDKVTLTAPERIYLQISDDPEHRNEEFSDAEVTWCSESVLECEVEYVRTDLAHPTSPDVVRDAERWRFFCEEMTHSYGDGYSEPEECHAQLTWRQGPWIRDGSNGGNGRPDTFPGWNSIIDEAMENQRRELADLEGEIAAAMAAREGGE